MSNQKYKAADVLKAKAIIAFATLIALIPLPIARRLGACIGWLLWRLNVRLAKVSRINIQLCFPQMSSPDVETLVKKSLIETGKTTSEMGVAWLKPPKYSLRLISSIHGEDIFKQAIAKNKGVIILMPHLGNWEIFNAYIVQHYTANGLYRPPRLKPLNDWILHVRQRTGANMIPAQREAIKQIPDILKKGENLFVLPDQEPGKGHGDFAPFFGVQALTMRFVSRLARETQAPVICLYALRRNNQFELFFQKADDGIYAEDLLTSQTALNKSIEACVLHAPEQYQWSYKRFKSRPVGEKKLYQF